MAQQVLRDGMPEPSAPAVSHPDWRRGLSWPSWLPWLVIVALWWLWSLEPFSRLGMATGDQVGYSLASADPWRSAVGYAKSQARIYFVFNKLVDLWIAARPERALRHAVNLGVFALSPCCLAYALFRKPAQWLLYIWLFASLSWVGFHHLPPAAYPTANHLPFILWALAAGWVRYRARRAHPSNVLSAIVFGVLAFVAFFQYEPIAAMSIAVLAWIVLSVEHGALRRTLWLALAVALASYIAAYATWRGFFPPSYDGARAGEFSPWKILRVTVAFTVGALPFCKAFTDAAPLRWGDGVVGEALIAFPARNALIPSVLGLALTVSAVVSVVYLYARWSASASLRPSTREHWLLAGVLLLVINGPLALSAKYQGWVTEWDDTYLTSQFALYALVLGGVLLLEALWRLRVRGVPVVFLAVAGMIGWLSLPVHAHNETEAARDRASLARWEAAAVIAHYAPQLPETNLVAPDFFYGVFIGEGDWGKYWRRYIRQRFAQSFRFYAGFPEGKANLALVRLHRFEDGRLRALSVQTPDEVTLLARPHEAPAQIFWSIGKGVALDWSKAEPLPRTDYLTLRLLHPSDLFGLDRVLELVWTTPGAGVFAPQRAPTQVSASKTYSALYPPEQAVDGLDGTEWLLPDASSGSLEIGFHAPRTLHAVGLKNSINLPHRDRATREFHVHAFAGERLLGSVSGSFPPLESARDWRELDLFAEGVTRLRIDIDSYYGLGGGLAEVDVR
ncbi:MAG: hypothetical protein ABI895_34180 [Deltaproteobacteria bacterium]